MQAYQPIVQTQWYCILIPTNIYGTGSLHQADIVLYTVWVRAKYLFSVSMPCGGEGLIADLGNSDDCSVFFCLKPEGTHEHSIHVIMLYLDNGPLVLSLQQPWSFKFEGFQRAYNVVGLPGTNFLQFLAPAHSHTLFMNHSLPCIKFCKMYFFFVVQTVFIVFFIVLTQSLQ